MTNEVVKTWYLELRFTSVYCPFSSEYTLKLLLNFMKVICPAQATEKSNKTQITYSRTSSVAIPEKNISILTFH